MLLLLLLLSFVTPLRYASATIVSLFSPFAAYADYAFLLPLRLPPNAIRAALIFRFSTLYYAITPPPPLL